MSTLKKASALVVAGALVSSSAFAAGLEKSVMWSGHYVGIGGAAVSNVNDSESLYFNPAGLAAVKGLSFSLNVSPTFSQFSAPVTAPNTQLSGGRIASFPFGVTAAYGVGEHFAIGAGAYISGGDRAEFNGVDFSGVNPAFAGFNPNLRSDVTINEYAIGAGIEPLDGLRFGLSYRIVHVSASLDLVRPTSAGGTPALASITEDGLSGTRYNGFKLGAQYVPKDSAWGLGAAWRTSIGFTASGTATTTLFVPAAGGLQPSTSADGTLSGVFPSQVQVGAYYDVLKKVRALLEYDWTEYFQNQSLDGTGGIRSLSTNWQNMNNYRIGVDCSAMDNWDFRAGFVLTSQVTPLGSAQPILSSPGTGKTITLGAGTTFMDKMLSTDVALEYSWAGGTVTTEGPTPGDYTSNDYAIHLGVSYNL